VWHIFLYFPLFLSRATILLVSLAKILSKCSEIIENEIYFLVHTVTARVFIRASELSVVVQTLLLLFFAMNLLPLVAFPWCGKYLFVKLCQTCRLKADYQTARPCLF
jgi:hypothetical protein